MMVGGNIGGKRVTILMDLGSTHNFLNESWVAQHGPAVEPLDSLGVSIADGQVILIEGIIRKLEWKIHDMTFQDDILVMKLGGCDMVLRVQWMDLLGYHMEHKEGHDGVQVSRAEEIPERHHPAIPHEPQTSQDGEIAAIGIRSI